MTESSSFGLGLNSIARTYFVAACLLFLSGTAGKAAEPEKWSCLITVTDKPESEAIIGYYIGSGQFVYDTIETNKRGTLKLETEKDILGGLYLVAFPDEGYFEFVLDPKEKGVEIQTSLSQPIKDLRANRSPENIAFNKFQRLRSEQGRYMDSLLKEVETRTEKEQDVKPLTVRIKRTKAAHTIELEAFAKSHKGTLAAKLIRMMDDPKIPDPKPRKDGKAIDTPLYNYVYTKTHYWDNVDFTDSRIIRTPLYKSKVMKFLGKGFTPQHPDSVTRWACYLLDKTYEENYLVFKSTLTWIAGRYERSDIMGMDGVFADLAARYYLTEKVNWMDEDQLGKLKDRYKKIRWNKLDAKAKDLIMIDYQGIPRSLNLVDADYTLLYFYSATCGHCKTVTPKVKAIYDEYRAKGFEVFGVSTDFDEVTNDEGEVINYRESREYRKYVKDEKLDWINVSDPSHQTNFRQYYDVYTTPVMYLLDKDKKIIGKRLNDVMLRRMLMNRIDGMSQAEITEWLKANGFLNEDGSVQKTEEE